MAYENIEISHSNFCVGPLAGTYCTVDTSDPLGARLIVKNDSGIPQSIFAFSPDSILHTDNMSGNANYRQVLGLEYTGPKDADYVTNMSFYTFERQKGLFSNHSSTCIVRRWALIVESNLLDLQQTFTLPYDSYTFAIDYYATELADHVLEGAGIIELPTTSGIEKYDSIMLGPSVDIDNPDAIEYCYVHSVLSATEVEIRTLSPGTPPFNQYTQGDGVTIRKNLYLFTNEGTLTPSSYTVTGGSLKTLDLNAYGTEIDSDSNELYRDVTVARWSSLYGTLSFIKQTNLLMLDLTDYEVTKSMFLSNVESNKRTVIPVYDIDYNGYAVFKLQKKTTKKDDLGGVSTSVWTNYNYQQDTFLPYSSALSLTIAPDRIFTRLQPADVTATVRDQYGVTLIGKEIRMYVTPDVAGSFDPPTPIEDSDTQGQYTAEFTAGLSYIGDVVFSASVNGSSASTGSSYVWCFAQASALSIAYSGHGTNFLTQITEDDNTMSLNQVSDIVNTGMPIKQLTKFSNPGGHWTSSSPPTGSHQVVIQVDEPTQNPTPVEQNKPKLYFQQIFALFNPEKAYQSMKLNQIVKTSDTLQVDQVYISRHYAYGHQDTTLINQFVFVQEARPVFYSEKNSIDTDIWLRLRPFAFSLDASTLKIEIKEYSYAGKEDWRDITSEGTITAFDAGGGILGLEFLWLGAESFHHAGVVYVRIEVYDQSPIAGGLGNKVKVDYWFTIVPDFRAPFLDNISPARAAEDVDPATTISFDIKDLGAGVDINSLEVFVDYRQIDPVITRYDKNHFSIFYAPPDPFINTDEVDVHVKVNDIQSNILLDGYRFNIIKGAAPWFDRDNFIPRLCQYGMPRTYNYVSVQVYGMGDGIDPNSIELHVDATSRDFSMESVVYRAS